ncbi:MAG: magnesium transporter [Clostridia bacterium]|nr:magnesium transporter [Clostridia bacterium]
MDEIREEETLKEEDKEKEENQEEREAVFEHPDYEHELVDIIRRDIPDEEKHALLDDYHDNDIASVLGELTQEERRKLYRLLGAEEVSEVFAYLDDASEYLEELTPEIAARIVQEMDADDAVDVLEDLDQEQQQAIIARMDEESRRDIRMIQSYPEDEIGSKMTTNYIAIRRGVTVKQAMRSLVEQAADNDNLLTIYVVEEDETFYGAITLQDLIIAREFTDLDSLIMTSYPCVYDHESVAESIEQLKDYSEDSIPVVDSDHRLLGVITSQDLVEVVDEEMGEDYAKLAGLTAEEDLNEPLTQSIRKRIPWLITLMFLGLVVSSVVGTFEAVMAALPIAVAFQSMILDMSGNSGTQSLAVTIRILTDDELTGAQRIRLIFKEARVGFTNGLILGSVSFLFVGLFVHFMKGKPFGPSFAMSGCIGIAMVIAMTISSLSGTLIPMFFKKVKIDPAVASGPMITTLSDLVAVVTYYSLVGLFLVPMQQMFL